MSIREWSRAPALRASLSVLAAAMLATGWTLVRALRVPALPESPPATLASLESITRTVPRPVADLSAAVDNDIFSIDRTAPTAPYLMPGEEDPTGTPMAPPEKPVVLGTAVATDGRSFATVQLSNQPPTLVHVGDKIGVWVVKAIERGKITLANTAGARVDVTVPKPGS